MDNVREGLLKFVIERGGKERCGLTWKEIAENFGLDAEDPIVIKRLSDWYRYYLQTGKILPDPESHGGHSDKVVVKTGLSIEDLKEYNISKAWGRPDNLQVVIEKKTLVQEDLLSQIVEDISKFSPKVPKIERKVPPEAIAYEVCMPDFHFGRIPVADGAAAYKQVFENLILRCTEPIERLILPIGNDLFNSDNIQYTTTRGTEQFDYDEWKTTFRTTWQTIVECINWAKQIAPVDIIMVPGNHDMTRVFYLGEILQGWYHNDANVTVDNSMEDFKYYLHGNTMIMYEHGELKPSEYPLIMAESRPDLWAASKYREVHTGHFHKEMVLDEYRTVKVRFIPSLAPNSAWESKKGYKNLKCAQAFRWSKEHGLLGINQVNVDWF